MALIKKLETGDKTQTPKPKTMKLHQPGYDSDTEYNLGTLYNDDTYDNLVKDLNISDPAVKLYFKAMVKAAENGQLTLNDDGSLKVTGDALSLRNLYDNIDDIDSKYKNGDETEFRRGINEESMNDVNAKNHGVFTSKGTRNFRNDLQAKAMAGALFKKALAASIYTPEPPKELTAYNGANYWTTLLAGQLGGNAALFASLSPELLLLYRKKAIEAAIADADNYYKTVSWKDAGNISLEEWKNRLNAAKESLEDGTFDANDNPAWAALGFGVYTKPLDTTTTTPLDTTNPLTYATEQEYVDAIIALAKKNAIAPLTQENLDSLERTARMRWKLEISKRDKSIQDAENKAQAEIDDADFENYWANYIDIPEANSWIYRGNYNDNPYVILQKWFPNDLYNFKLDPSNKKIKLLGTNLLEKAAILSTLIALTLSNNDLTQDEVDTATTNIADPRISNTLNVIDTLLEAKSLAIQNQKEAEANIIDSWLRFFIRPNADTGEYIILNAKLDLVVYDKDHKDRLGYVLVYDPNLRKLIKKKRFDVLGESFKNLHKLEWLKLRHVQSNKNGGVIGKYLLGGKYSLEEQNSDIMDTAMLTENYLDSQKYNEKGVRKVGVPLASTSAETSLGDVSYELKGEDYARLASAATDIASIIASSTGAGAPIGLGLGLVSTLTNLGANIHDDRVSAGDTAKEFSIGLGLDVLGALPWLGIGAKGTKIAKILKPVSYGLMAVSATYLPEAVGSIKKLVSHPTDMTVDDWRLVAAALSMVAGAGAGIRNRHTLNKGILTEKVVNVTGANGVEYKNILKKDMQAIYNAKTLEEQLKLFRLATGVSAEEAQAALTTPFEHWGSYRKRWTGDLKEDSMIKRLFGNWDTSGGNTPFRQGYNEVVVGGPTSKERPWFRYSDELLAAIKSGKKRTPIKGAPELTKEPAKTEDAAKTKLATEAAEEAVKESLEAAKETVLPKELTVELAAQEQLVAQEQLAAELVSASMSAELAALYAEAKPKRVINQAIMQQGKSLHRALSYAAVHNQKLTDTEIRKLLTSNGKSASADNIAKVKRYLSRLSLVLEYLAPKKHNGGTLVLKALNGDKVLPEWFTKLYGYDITDMPTDFDSNYNQRAANSIAGKLIDNAAHHLHTLQTRFDRNTAYTKSDNYTNRNTDLTNALNTYTLSGDPANFGLSLVEAYNKDIKSIRDYLGQNRAYNTTGATLNNLTYKKLFGTASNELGYEDKLLDIYGTHSYLRIGDAYEKEFGDDLSDDDFKNRTFKYTKDGKDYYFGKKANGDITLLNDQQIARYNLLSNVQNNKTDEDPETGTGSGIIDTDFDFTNLTNPLDKYKIRPDRVLEWTRFANALRTNKLALKELLAYKPLLRTSYHDNALIHGDMFALNQGLQAKALMLASANLPMSNSVETQLGAKALATLNGNLAQTLAANQDQSMQYKTIDNALAINNANTQRDVETENYNKLNIINPYAEERAHLKANYKETRGDIIGNAIAGVQLEYLNINNSNKQLALENLKEDTYQRLKAAYALYLIHKDSGQYEKEMDKIRKENLEATKRLIGNYSNVWFTNIAKSGNKIDYHHRNLLQSARDFNKAMREDKKHLYEVTTFNHKNRKK